MPDLQSELSKVINDWSKPDAPAALPGAGGNHQFQPSKGTSRATAEYIMNNPGMHYRDVVQAMVDRGHSVTSLRSLLTQMKRQGLVTDTDGRLTANYTQYTPIKSYASWKLQQSRAAATPKRKYTRRNAEAKAAAYEAHENFNPTAASTFDAAEFVDGLTLRHAKDLYDELRKVFGNGC